MKSFQGKSTNKETKCFKDLYDYELVKKCRVCKNISLKSKFNKIKTKNDGYRSECRSCCKEYYYYNGDQLLNIMKNYNKQKRKKINLREKIKRKFDFKFKLAHNIRVRTHHAFKSQNIEKLNKTLI